MPQIDCPNCGAPIDSGERACPYCGAAIKASAPVPPQIQLDRDLFSGNIGLNANDSDEFREVREQIARGNKIEAIKIYREKTGVGLKEAKDAVEALEAGSPVVVSQANLASGAAQGGAAGLADQAAKIAAIKDYLQQGKKIEAIKAYREITGSSLAEAKSAVEALEAGQPLFSSAATVIGASAAAGAGFASSAEMMDEVKNQLRRGNKIWAVKAYREYYNVGLKEAKDAVDAVETELRFQPAPVADTEPPAFARPDAPTVEPVVSPNPFDEPKAPAWRKWLVGCGIGALVFLCVCVLLPVALLLAGVLRNVNW